MRKLDDLMAVLEQHPSQWSRTQRQLYIDSMLSTLIAFAEKEDIETTKFIMLARLNVEIKRLKELDELSDIGTQLYRKLSKNYQRNAKSVLNGSYSDKLWSKLDLPRVKDPSKEPKRWPKARREIYRAGAIAIALYEKQKDGRVPALSVRKVEDDVLKFVPRPIRNRGRRSTFGNTWKAMNPVAHFCAGILKVIPPNAGEILNSESRIILASRIVDLIEQSNVFYQFLGSISDEDGKGLVKDQISLSDLDENYIKNSVSKIR